MKPQTHQFARYASVCGLVLLMGASGLWWAARRIEGSLVGNASAAVPFEVVDSFESTPGEGKVPFLQRVAARLVAFSSETGFEACGAIGTRTTVDANGDGFTRYGVTLVTVHSNIGCVVQFVAPEGFEVGPSSQTIHSHGKATSYKVNAVDVVLSGGRLRINAWEGGRDQNRFSPLDMTHAGYLAARTGLLYQPGTGESGVVTNFGGAGTALAVVP
jgi:hypothetical protein